MSITSKPARNLQRKPWHFDVSTGLKRVLGTELITDDEVAIFELVKNSFDARARTVQLYFDEGRIIIVDNGRGMSRKDLQDKWLFVAYSSKRDVNRNGARRSFRDDVADRQHYAGSKGIGRFSSDRLGRFVTVQTRHKTEASGPVHKIAVDWNLFDDDHTQHFEDVEVDYQRTGEFQLPEDVKKPKFGTVIEISGLRREWARSDILTLKAGLAKLINPFGAKSDRFEISIIAPREIAQDQKVKEKATDKDIEFLPSKLVNGEVRNFIFATLQDKTTFIDVSLDKAGRHIESKLIDRGEVIYRIREPNPFRELASSKFRCQLFFLNQSAKVNFARRVGLRSVQFGSVFLFRNDFRVFPIGEEGDDWFRLDRRKQQGYARYLGTRDIIGRY
jgi:Histidine kinase-, DNA gyrase B-, and HSP90-like ATPase